MLGALIPPCPQGFFPGPLPIPLWQELEPGDPDLSLVFVLPEAHVVELVAFRPLALAQSAFRKTPVLLCSPLERGWRVEVVVGLSQLYLKTGALRTRWPALGLHGDTLLTRLVRAYVRPALTPPPPPFAAPALAPDTPTPLAHPFPVTLYLPAHWAPHREPAMSAAAP